MTKSPEVKKLHKEGIVMIREILRLNEKKVAMLRNELTTLEMEKKSLLVKLSRYES